MNKLAQLVFAFIFSVVSSLGTIVGLGIWTEMMDRKNKKADLNEETIFDIPDFMKN